MRPFKRSGWPKGIDNTSNWRDMPADALRDAVNMDPLASGSMALRAGFSKLFDGTAVRGLLAVGDTLLAADGTELVSIDARTGATSVLASIAGAGRFTGDVLNSELFFCTDNETLRFKNGVLRRWGVPTVHSQPLPAVVTGGLQAGGYQLAMTWLNEYGEEGGTVNPLHFRVNAGSGLSVTLPERDGYTPQLYVSAPNGATLYLQAKGAGAHRVARVDDSTARLDTLDLRDPLPGKYIARHNAVLAIADGNTLWLTDPLRPHLRRAASGFFQYSDPIDVLASTEQGLYVGADRTWFVTGIEGGEPVQREALPFPAVAGSTTRLPDGRAAWMTRYGLAVSTVEGGAQLLNSKFVPELGETGASGVLERNGNQLVVSTLKGSRTPNPLAAADYYEAEIELP